MKRHIIAAVVRNAEKHEHKHQPYSGTGWDSLRDLRLLRRLMEEMGELAAAIDGTHEHPMDLELVQIGGIVLNWLQARGIDEEHMAILEALDAIKHPPRPGIGPVSLGPRKEN